MTPLKVYVTRMIPDEGLARLRERCEVSVNPEDRPLTRAELLTRSAGMDGVLGLLTDRIDAGFFDAVPGLKGYANYAVGYDNIDLPEATRRGIPVSNTPDVLTQATAELAWTLLLAVARRVVESDRVMRSGTWPGWGPLQFIGADVSGKTLGIVGPGRIGQAMARMSKGFGMRVVYWGGRQPSRVLEDEMGAERLSFAELLSQSDFISVHLPLNPETRHLFNADTLRMMKPTAFLINTARGPVIDEADLVEALNKRIIAGAGLDVYEAEPKMAPGLDTCPPAVLLPHVGSGTHSSRTGMALLAAENLLAMLEGRTPPTCLNPEVLSKK